MNVSLTPELEQYINEQLRCGLYDSANEVIGEGLRLLRKRDEVQQTKGRPCVARSRSASNKLTADKSAPLTNRQWRGSRPEVGNGWLRSGGPSVNEPRFTEQAEADLTETWFHPARNNPKAADRVIESIQDAARKHVPFPESGRSREDLGPGLRSFTVKPYVVFYRPIAGTIEVVRVLHGRRDIRRIMRDEG